MNPTLGLPMLTFYGTGMILGAGIYSIIGKAAGETGEGLWLGFLVAAVAALLTALSYAELSTMFPKAGAEYVYLTHAFPSTPWLGATLGTLMSFAGASTAAAVAVAFGGYLREFADVPVTLIALAVVASFTLLALAGIRQSGWVTAVSTLIEAGGLVLVIALGFMSPTFGEALAAIPHQGLMTGAALIVFAFFGFENIVSLAEEAKHPERDLPRAILLSLAIATVLYFFVALAAVSLMPPAKLAASGAPLMEATRAGSPRMATILGAVALFATANTALISIIGASRVLYGMGDAGAIPKMFSFVLSKRKTPWLATLVTAGAALALLPLRQLETIASVSSFATLSAFAAINVALIRLRFTDHDRRRPFRVPLTIGRWPILPTAAAAMAAALLTQLEARAFYVGVPLMLVLVAFFMLYARSKRNS
ncbi:MAG: amino acid permease [Bdellovibrionaceae bacterium]|nr:amino acid permease [Pseudobdellovibrionaceae bacterium]